MNETLRAELPKVGEATIDAEHHLEVQLLDSLIQTVERSADFASIKHVLEQFIEFSDMHFLSEQLVMRLHGYPDYESHLEQHTQLMKKIRESRETVFRGEKTGSLEMIHELRDRLLTHIATEDVAFGEYLGTKENPW